MSERNSEILAWAGTCLSVVMHVSYGPHIAANFPGIIFGLLAAITAL